MSRGSIKQWRELIIKKKKAMEGAVACSAPHVNDFAPRLDDENVMSLGSILEKK